MSPSWVMSCAGLLSSLPAAAEAAGAAAGAGVASAAPAGVSLLALSSDFPLSSCVSTSMPSPAPPAPPACACAARTSSLVRTCCSAASSALRWLHGWYPARRASVSASRSSWRRSAVSERRTRAVMRGSRACTARWRRARLDLMSVGRGGGVSNGVEAVQTIGGGDSRPERAHSESRAVSSARFPLARLPPSTHAPPRSARQPCAPPCPRPRTASWPPRLRSSSQCPGPWRGVWWEGRGGYRQVSK